MMVRFEYGAFGEKLEKQANAQGYTLGKYAETFDKLMFSLNMVRIHGLITDSQADTAYKKLNKKVISKLSPLNDETHDAKELGIETATPEEIARIKSLWEVQP